VITSPRDARVRSEHRTSSARGRPPFEGLSDSGQGRSDRSRVRKSTETARDFTPSRSAKKGASRRLAQIQLSVSLPSPSDRVASPFGKRVWEDPDLSNQIAFLAPWPR
jgi:hypothetical protein